MKFEREYFERGPYAKRGGYGAIEAEAKRYFLSLLRHLEKSKIEYKNGKGKRTLDVGCAYGYMLEILRGFGYDIYGIDISKYAIRKAKNRLPQGKFAVHDIQKGIPFKVKFDLITCIDAIEHLQNPEISVKNCYKALKQGGIFLASTANKREWRGYFSLLSSKEKADETHVNVRTAEEWERCFNTLRWQMLKVVALQTVPIVWRFGIFYRIPFPLGDVMFIACIK